MVILSDLIGTITSVVKLIKIDFWEEMSEVFEDVKVVCASVTFLDKLSHVWSISW